MLCCAKTLLIFLCIIGSVLSNYDPDFARIALLRAYSAYCFSGEIQSWSCYWCNATKKPGPVTTINVTNDNIFAYVGQEDDVIWVVVRGTQVRSIVNWINNVDFILIPLWLDNITIDVHMGFLQDTKALYPGILAAVRSRLEACPECSILLTGHSLGGSIVSILSAEFSRDIPGVPIAEWTFGSPRTGNPAFSHYHVGTVPVSWRVVNQRDVVPHLPTKFLNIFQHVSTEVWYDNSTTSYRICDGSGEDPTCSDKYNPVTGNVVDHLTYFGIDLRIGGHHGC